MNIGTCTMESKQPRILIKTFKEEVDSYFILKYSQLESTINKIIIRKQFKIKTSNVISETYLYIIQNEYKITSFAKENNKSIKHIIYSFCLRHINADLTYNSVLMREDNKLSRQAEQIIDNEEDDIIDNYGSIILENDIYTEDFIKSFYKSLNKLDAICFNVYYYEGVSTAEDFSNHFNISLSSAYVSINRLKKLLKLFITKHQIH